MKTFFQFCKSDEDDCSIGLKSVYVSLLSIKVVLL